MTKPSSLTLFAALVLAWAGCQSQPAAPHGKTVVNYLTPEKFTDVKSTFSGPTDQGYLDALRDHLITQAANYIPAGQTLTLTFTDIDMAGDIDPRLRDTRVIRSIYPVRLNFSWAVTDASGKVLKEGKEELVDVFPSAEMGYNRGDPLFSEKTEMDNWMRKHLR